MTAKQSGWTSVPTLRLPFDVNLEAVTAWVRLWWPQIVASGPAAVVLLRFLHPRTSEPWPGLGAVVDDSPAYRAWRDSIERPAVWEIVVGLTLAGALLMFAWWLDFKPGMARRRRRKLRYRWERTAVGRVTRLKRIKVGQGVITADCSIQKRAEKTNWSEIEAAFDPDNGHFLRGLDVDRAWRAPNRASFTETGYYNAARTRGIKLSFLALGDPKNLPIWEEPARGSEFFFGYDEDGPAFVDLAETPHVALRGATGGGKGVEFRIFVAQALRAGQLVAVIDGGNSPEHAAADPAPTYWRPMRATMTKPQRYQAAIDMLKQAVVRLSALRSQIGELLLSNGITESSEWRFWPDDIKAWQPEVLLGIDEMSTLLAKGEPELEPYRKELRALLGGDLLRNARKFGIHALLVDQTATLTTSLPHGDVAQAEHVIVFGDMDSIHARAATDRSKLPKLSGGARKLAAFYVRRGTTELREIRLPLMKEPDLRRAALAVGGAT